MGFSKLTRARVVGNDDCTYAEIASLIGKNEKETKALICKLQTLARILKVHLEIGYKIRVDLLTELKSIEGVISDILEHWRKKYGNKATAVAFYAALNRCRLKKAAAAFADKYIPIEGRCFGLQLHERGAFKRSPAGGADLSDRESIYIINSSNLACTIGKLVDTTSDTLYTCEESDITTDHAHIVGNSPVTIICLANNPEKLAAQIYQVQGVRYVLLRSPSDSPQEPPLEHGVLNLHRNVIKLEDTLEWVDLTEDFQSKIKQRKVRYCGLKISLKIVMDRMRMAEADFTRKYLHSDFLLQLVNNTEPEIKKFDLGPIFTYNLIPYYTTSFLPLPFFTLLLLIFIASSWNDMFRVYEDNWKDLNSSHKMEILRKPVQVQGWRSNVSRICDMTGSNPCEFLTSGFISAVKNNSEYLSLLNINLPPIPDFTIPRTLLLRDEVRPSIFQANTSDILVISKMQPGDLSNLVRGQPLVTSANYLSHTNFHTGVIILSKISDLHEIVLFHPKRNVHWLHFRDGKFFWKNSTGSIHLIQQHLAQTQSRVTEETFLKERDSHPKTPVCIASGPGMGKTTTTIRLATRLQNRIILYATSSFPAYLKDLFGVTINKDLLPQILAVSYGKTEYEYKLIKSGVLHSKVPIFELILDGIDEVPEDLRDLVLQLIEAASVYKSVRVWVITKPHLQQHLEARLSTLCYSIQPLTHKEMVDFLIGYWASFGDKHIINGTRLEIFAKACVHRLNDWKSHSPADKEYSGSILVCLLLAQINKTKALQFANINNVLDSEAPADVDVTLPEEIFTEYIDDRLKTVPNKRAYRESFISIAIHSKFPAWGQRLTLHEPLPNDDLISTGILEKSGGEHKFFHSSFSDYFLAEFAVQVIQNGGTPEKTAFVEVLLGTTNSSNFQHRDVAYFLNNFHRHQNPLGNPTKLFSTASLSEFRAVLHAAIQNDFIHLTQLFLGSEAYDKYSPYVFDDAILTSAVQHARLQLLNLTLSEYLKVGNLSAEDLHQIDLIGDNAEPRTLLDPALQRGEFAVVDYLLKTQKFQEPILRASPKFQRVLTPVLISSRDDSPETVSQRMNIIKKLVGLNPNLLKEVESLSELDTVHPKLMAEVICLQNQAKMSTTALLHAAAEQLAPIAFNEFITQVPNEILAAQARTRNQFGRTLLMTIIQHFDPLFETLYKLNMTGADFNAVNSSGDSIVAMTIMRHRNPETLEDLLDFGANCSDVNLQHWNCLHVAATYGTPEAVEVLARRSEVDINEPNSDGNTPLHLASKVVDTRTNETLQILIAFGGNVNAINNLGSTPLHSAASRCNVMALKILVEAGGNVLLKNGRSLTVEVVAGKGMDENQYTRKECRDFVDLCKKFAVTMKRRAKSN